MAAIFGPQTPASAEHIRSITKFVEIPFFDTRWNYHPVNPVLTMKLTNFLPFYFSVTAERETCNLLQKGVAAIFGPQTPASAEHIRSITDVAEIPFIDTRWNYHPVNPVLTSNDRNAYTINLHPDVDTVGKRDLKIQVTLKRLGVKVS